MSRIGKQPVVVPAGVKIKLADGNVFVEGPKGKLEMTYHPMMNVKYDEGAKQVGHWRDLAPLDAALPLNPVSHQGEMLRHTPRQEGCRTGQAPVRGAESGTLPGNEHLVRVH